jgi:hypothetical protein
MRSPPESICCFVPPPPGCYVPPSHCGQEARPPGRLNRPPPIDANSIGNPPPPSHCGQEARPPGTIEQTSAGRHEFHRNPPPPPERPLWESASSYAGSRLWKACCFLWGAPPGPWRRKVVAPLVGDWSDGGTRTQRPVFMTYEAIDSGLFDVRLVLLRTGFVTITSSSHIISRDGY